ncbi:MAG: TetR/AcrR family transcriptional regulator [Blautia caecimuris]
MNYSNSQRAGVILYLAASLFGGYKRTLNDFMCTMFTMLSEKNFEEITVGELCKCANYPRATFYNYFDDKFDLLNYCWIGLTQEIHLEEYHHMAHEEALYIFFDRIYDYSKKTKKRYVAS